MRPPALLRVVHLKLCHVRDGEYPKLWSIGDNCFNRMVYLTVAILIAVAPNAERALAIRKSTFLE